MASVFKITGRKGKKLAHWYGKIAVSTDKRIRVKLFTDKTASERRLMELQREADQRASGVRTVAMDYAMVSVDQHAKDYLESLRLEKRDTGTLRIGEWTLDKLIEWGKWHRISDVTADSMRNILTGLDRQGLTPSYQNKFIMRAKAFVHWLQREGRINADPLANLKRVDERNGRRTRARRALTDAESSALLLNSPEDRREKYAWAILAGLRRSELKELRWGDLRLNAPRPFIQLRPEQTKNGNADALPIHPYLLNMIQQRMPGMPETSVVASVPDMKTMKKDLSRAGIALADAKGRRADYHALRHTYCTNLDRTGCSYTTKRALMRHSDSGVTEGYSHARLDELYAAIERLPYPGAEDQSAAVRTGTDEQPLDHLLDQSAVVSGPTGASTGTTSYTGDETCDSEH
jgi:integrase